MEYLSITKYFVKYLSIIWKLYKKLLITVNIFIKYFSITRNLCKIFIITENLCRIVIDNRLTKRYRLSLRSKLMSTIWEIIKKLSAVTLNIEVFVKLGKNIFIVVCSFNDN